jgi:hypothetical protein
MLPTPGRTCLHVTCSIFGRAAPGKRCTSQMLLARLADKPLIFQENVVTKPRRVKLVKRRETANIFTHDAVDDCTAETMLGKFMRREMNVLGCFKHCRAVTRKVKRITSIIGPTMIAVEQQPTSRHICCNI